MESNICAVFFPFLSSCSDDLKSAFLGAVVGGLFALLASLLAYWLTAIGAIQMSRKVRRNTFLLLKTEINTAWKLFKEEYLTDLLKLKDETPYLCIFPIGENSFPLYDSSPMALAEFPPPTTELLIRLYMRAKGLIKMIELNNSDVENCLKHGQGMLLEHSRFLTTNHPELSTAERIRLLNEYYSHQTKWMASLSGMDSTALAMKNISLEIALLIQKINSIKY